MKPNFTNYNQSVVKQSLTPGANDKSTIKQSLTVESRASERGCEVKTVACEMDHRPYGTVCRCIENKMRQCAFFEEAKGFEYTMCEHNLDPAQIRGSCDSITDFCFHPEARQIARNNDDKKGGAK